MGTANSLLHFIFSIVQVISVLLLDTFQTPALATQEIATHLTMGSFPPLILCLSGPNKLAQTAQLHLGSTQNLHMNKPFKGPQRGKQVLYIMLSFSLGSYIYIYRGSYSGEWP